MSSLVDDWKYEVQNGDTVLGFADWCEHKAEADSKHTGDTISSLSELVEHITSPARIGKG